MNADGSADVVRTVLPPALEIATAWSVAEDGDPAFFSQALRRVVSDAMEASDPRQACAELLFGMSSLSGILADELATRTDSTREQVLQSVHARYVEDASA